MCADCPIILWNGAPATQTWPQTLAAVQHTVTSASKTDPTDTSPPQESNSSVLKSLVQTPMEDGTVDGSEKFITIPIHTSPDISVESQTFLLENVPNGTDHFLACPLHLIDADETLENDDITGVNTHTHTHPYKQSTRKKGGSTKTIDHGHKEKKPRHKSLSPRRDIIVPERPQSQHAHSLAIARQVIEHCKIESQGTPTT
ncbi:hypothetical protein PR048_027410 [Dryococelus australis]|uniref:Uncharacterized protein n=1 Tax=Dryococelus australis TaxID=614101 RepID=A0ABQ9GGD3_9NEOP|nr:hypothetical protein PR048_027410 [Dryococelus australis]